MLCLCVLPVCAGALKGGEPRGNLTSREWDHLPLKKPASFSAPTNQAQHAVSAQGRCSTVTPYGHKTQQPERPRHSLLFPANICKSQHSPLVEAQSIREGQSRENQFL